MDLLIANSNPVHKKLEDFFKEHYNATIIHTKEELNITLLNNLNPTYLFFPHWSFIIPEAIYSNYECIVFHMTDLPYGRGGSPLQNLITRGHKETVISALKVDQGLDTGDIYLKQRLPLYGTAEEIFLRAGEIMKDMIETIIKDKLLPKPQQGESVTFKRRKPEDGNIEKLETLENVFDYIRMLDAEGYPKAFLETPHLRFEFGRASLKKDNIIADVRIIKK